MEGNGMGWELAWLRTGGERRREEEGEAAVWNERSQMRGLLL